MPDDEAVVTTTEIWRNASTVTVKIGTNAPQPDIPVLKIFNTPAMITIKETDFKKGVVILNETVLRNEANNQDPIETQDKKTFNLTIVPKTQKLIPVPVFENSGWPTGEIVFWE